MSATLPCDFCGTAVDITKPHYQRVHGWERGRSAGGTNQITLREVDAAVVACYNCVQKRKDKISQDQGAMW